MQAWRFVYFMPRFVLGGWLKALGTPVRILHDLLIPVKGSYLRNRNNLEYSTLNFMLLKEMHKNSYSAKHATLSMIKKQDGL